MIMILWLYVFHHHVHGNKKEWNWSIFIALIINHHNHYEIINYYHNSYAVKAVGAICEDLRWNMRILLGESCLWKELFFFVKISLERNYSFWGNSSGSGKCPPRLSQSQEMQWGVQVGIFSNIPLHHVGILQDWIVQEAEVVCWTEVPGVFISFS